MDWWTSACTSLQWRHNARDGVSNHQPRDCLRNRLFKPHIKENIEVPRHWTLWPVNSPHKGPVTRKIFPFDDVIMNGRNLPDTIFDLIFLKEMFVLLFYFHCRFTLMIPFVVSIGSSNAFIPTMRQAITLNINVYMRNQTSLRLPNPGLSRGSDAICQRWFTNPVLSTSRIFASYRYNIQSSKKILTCAYIVQVIENI